MNKPEDVGIKGMPDLEDVMSPFQKVQNSFTQVMQGKQMYAGTVPHATIEKRRKKNKDARKARKANRRATA